MQPSENPGPLPVPCSICGILLPFTLAPQSVKSVSLRCAHCGNRYRGIPWTRVDQALQGNIQVLSKAQPRGADGGGSGDSRGAT